MGRTVELSRVDWEGTAFVLARPEPSDPYLVARFCSRCDRQVFTFGGVPQTVRAVCTLCVQDFLGVSDEELERQRIAEEGTRR